MLISNYLALFIVGQLIYWHVHHAICHIFPKTPIMLYMNGFSNTHRSSRLSPEEWGRILQRVHDLLQSLRGDVVYEWTQINDKKLSTEGLYAFYQGLRARRILCEDGCIVKVVMRGFWGFNLPVERFAVLGAPDELVKDMHGGYQVFLPQPYQTRLIEIRNRVQSTIKRYTFPVTKETHALRWMPLELRPYFLDSINRLRAQLNAWKAEVEPQFGQILEDAVNNIKEKYISAFWHYTLLSLKNAQLFSPEQIHVHDKRDRTIAALTSDEQAVVREAIQHRLLQKGNMDAATYQGYLHDSREIIDQWEGSRISLESLILQLSGLRAQRLLHARIGDIARVRNIRLDVVTLRYEQLKEEDIQSIITNATADLTSVVEHIVGGLQKSLKSLQSTLKSVSKSRGWVDHALWDRMLNALNIYVQYTQVMQGLALDAQQGATLQSHIDQAINLLKALSQTPPFHSAVDSPDVIYYQPRDATLTEIQRLAKEINHIAADILRETQQSHSSLQQLAQSSAFLNMLQSLPPEIQGPLSVSHSSPSVNASTSHEPHNNQGLDMLKGQDDAASAQDKPSVIVPGADITSSASPVKAIFASAHPTHNAVDGQLPQEAPLPKDGDNTEHNIFLPFHNPRSQQDRPQDKPDSDHRPQIPLFL